LLLLLCSLVSLNGLARFFYTKGKKWKKNLSVGNVVRNTKNHFAQLTTFLYVVGVRVKKKKAGY